MEQTMTAAMIWVGLITVLIIGVPLFYCVLPTRILKSIRKHEYNSLANKNDIYLTFDDGPSNFTPELIALLKKYEVKASFFMVAEFAKKNPDIVKLVASEGHDIAMHSLSHRDALFQSPWKAKKDFEESLKIFNALGVRVRIFRPPWGRVNLVSLYMSKKYDCKVLLWDVMAQDWQKGTTPEIIADKLRRRVIKSSVICLHDGRGKNNAPARTIRALETMLPYWQSRGYSFKGVNELYGAENK